jgi:hypothetical protein
VQLIGPPDGGRAGPTGAVLSCETSEHAMSYELLFGPDAEAMTVSVSETSSPPDALIGDLPYTPTVWTIRVRDAVGSTIFASPRAIMPYEPLPVRRAGRRVRPSP